MNKAKKRTFEIALAGISSAFAVICIVLSYYVKNMTLSFYALSSVALMLPLLINSVFGFLGAYAVSSLVSFFIVGYIPIMPFMLFVGVHTISIWLVERYPNIRWLSLPIKAGYAIGIFFALVKIMSLSVFSFPIFENLSITPQWWYIVLIIVVLFVGYDFLMQAVFKFIRQRLSKIIYKYQPQKQGEKQVDKEQIITPSVADNAFSQAPDSTSLKDDFFDDNNDNENNNDDDNEGI